MSLDRWFRLLSSLTLGLSCGALVFAEVPFLPDLPICLPPVLALLLLAWWIEGRWRLPNWGANILGLFIAAGGIVWLVGQLADEESLLVRLPLQLALLPYMGPLLIAALLVKVFGGSLDAGDFWRLQGLGLMQISLGCVLDGGPMFGALLAAYLASGLACLALRYRLSFADDWRNTSSQHRARAASSLSAGRLLSFMRGNTGPASIRPTGALFSARWLLSFTLLWTLLIAVPALFLFLLTPRRDNNAWEPLGSLRSGQLRTTGGSEEINLNTTGRVQVDDAIALEVTAVDAAGQPKLDLPTDQRWRGVVLDSYENGKWTPMHAMPSNPQRRGQKDLPDFGPQQFFLNFTVRAHQPGALVLAEPVRLGLPPTLLPVKTLSDNGRPRLFSERMGTVVPLSFRSQREHRYCQVVPALEPSSRMPAQGVHPGHPRIRLITVPFSLEQTLRPWTIDLLRRLSQDERFHLPDGVRTALAQPPLSFLIEPDDWEATALALTDYLAHSGEYTYTLELARSNPSLDPVMDFLANVKQGHCERYASALTLMLRSVGIPARVVKGFRGCDNLGDGQYVVRHYHAHAWVEILAPRPDWREKNVLPLPPGDGIPPAGEAGYDWLALDPTPAEDAASPKSSFSLAHLWEGIPRLVRQGWQTLIIDYSADEQADLWDTLKSFSHLAMLWKLGLAVAAGIAVLSAALFLRRLSRRRSMTTAVPSSTASFYPRLLRILDRYAGLRPGFGQTPREYGEAARAFLQTHPALRALAEVPLRVVDLFYRVRFGGRPLNREEHQTLEAELDRFTELVRQEASGGR